MAFIQLDHLNALVEKLKNALQHVPHAIIGFGVKMEFALIRRGAVFMSLTRMGFFSVVVMLLTFEIAKLFTARFYTTNVQIVTAFPIDIDAMASGIVRVDTMK